MLRKNQKALQMRQDGNWKYVFCIVKNQGNKVAFTDDRRKALAAKYNLEYFQNHYANNYFRAA